MTTLSVEIPENIFPVLRYNPDELAREMRLAAAAFSSSFEIALILIGCAFLLY